MKKILLITLMLISTLCFSQLKKGDPVVFFPHSGNVIENKGSRVAYGIVNSLHNDPDSLDIFAYLNEAGYQFFFGNVKKASSLSDALGGGERWTTMKQAIAWGIDLSDFGQVVTTGTSPNGVDVDKYYINMAYEVKEIPDFLLTEIDPVWISEKSNYYTKTQADGRYLQSYTETDPQFNTKFSGKSTSDLSEGTNLYYTSTRFNSAFGGKTTTDLAEGTNLYYTAGRFNTALATKTTTDLGEGTNLYFTNSRARSAISLTTIGSGAATYNSGTGVLNIPTPSATGTVTSVGITSTDFSVSGSPVTTSGNITANLNTSGISAGTYSSVTVNTKGIATAGTNRSINDAPGRSLVSTTSSTGFQISSTRDATVNYEGVFQTTSTIGGPSSITVFLETANTNSTTPGDWTIIAQQVNSNTITLAVVLQQVDIEPWSLTRTIPAGKYVRIRYGSVTGTASATINTQQQEVTH